MRGEGEVRGEGERGGEDCVSVGRIVGGSDGFMEGQRLASQLSAGSIRSDHSKSNSSDEPVVKKAAAKKPKKPKKLWEPAGRKKDEGTPYEKDLEQQVKGLQREVSDLHSRLGEAHSLSSARMERIAELEQQVEASSKRFSELMLNNARRATQNSELRREVESEQHQKDLLINDLISQTQVNQQMISFRGEQCAGKHRDIHIAMHACTLMCAAVRGGVDLYSSYVTVPRSRVSKSNTRFNPREFGAAGKGDEMAASGTKITR